MYIIVGGLMSAHNAELRKELFTQVTSLKEELRVSKCLDKCFTLRNESNLSNHTSVCEDSWVKYWNNLLDLFRD